MLSSSEPRTTQPLMGEQEQARITIQLPLAPPTGPLGLSPTNTRVPVLIRGSAKRHTSSVPLSPPRLHKRRLALPGAIIGGILIFLIGSLFVIPLDNSQHASPIFGIIGNLFSSSNTQPDAINTSQQVGTPTNGQVSGGACQGTNLWNTCAMYVTQSGVEGTGHLQRPILGAVISQYFDHPEYQYWCSCWRPHNGIDLAAPYGTPIMAADAGQVIWVGWDWTGLGWAVKISHGSYIATVYGHLDHYIVKVGQSVTKGQVIGYEGTSGASTGPHLHFMVLVHNVWVNPLLYVALP